MNNLPNPFKRRRDYVGSSVIRINFLSIGVLGVFMLASLLYLNHSIKSDHARIREAAEIQFKIDELLDSMLSQQVDQRTFLETGNDLLLEQYQQDNARFRVVSTELLDMLGAYPEYVDQAKRLINLGDRWHIEHGSRLLFKKLRDEPILASEIMADKQDFDVFRSEKENLSDIFDTRRIDQRHVLLNHLNVALLVIGLAFAAFQCLFLYVTQRRLRAVRRPLTQLEHFVADYTAGSSSASLPAYEYRDEIGRLVDKLRKMQESKHRNSLFFEEKYNLLARLSLANTLEEVYRESVAGLARLLDVGRVMLVTSNRDGGFSAKAQFVDGVIEMNPPHAPLKREQSYAIRQHTHSLIFNDWHEEKPHLSTAKSWEAENLRSSMHVPIRCDGQNIGYLNLASDRADFFTPFMMQRMEKIAQLIAGSLKNATDSQNMQLAAMKDGLTGVWNRRHFDQELDKLIESAKKNDPSVTAFSLILIDVDHFKRFNDTWGHTEGDQVLQHVANMLETFSRPNDLVARFGGEEFAVLLPGESLREAGAAAERLRKLIEYDSCSPAYQITASFGVAEYFAELGKEPLIQKADRALYRAKQLGRNRVESEDREETAHIAENL
ncbi:diguanylate cyclase [Saccharibacillus sacchari]|uniref:Diguanylate cyclase n=1 Tax=Saccharibacillus sacchari TaxID=456493 RepID=A0ACC6PJI5_9BACL